MCRKDGGTGRTWAAVDAVVDRVAEAEEEAEAEMLEAEVAVVL